MDTHAAHRHAAHVPRRDGLHPPMIQRCRDQSLLETK